MSRRQIAFVVPRYGRQVLGGAETLARLFAEGISSAGLADVSVLTTCAQDHFTWKNEFPPGVTLSNGVPVHRFPIDAAARDVERYQSLHLRMIQSQKLSTSEEYAWVDQSAHSPMLYNFIESQGRSFDLIIFVPYLFGTTFYGSAIYPERSILWPCLHDEVYARMRPTRSMYHSCLGVWFNSYPESRLARRLYGWHRGEQVIGVGFDLAQQRTPGLRKACEIQGPFMLYSGRFEAAKNVPLLLNYFSEYKRRRKNSLKLVLMGQGPERIPVHPDIINVGFREGEAKLAFNAAATILCQPSVNESFSIVIMESWLYAVPILVNAQCEVTRYHATQSNGGLYFSDYDEFESAVDLLLSNDSLRRRMGQNGEEYVRTQYSSSAVMERFEHAMEFWVGLK